MEDQHVDRQTGDQSKMDKSSDLQRRSGDHGPLVSGNGQMENINADEKNQGRVDQLGKDSGERDR
jgi:hypothetical protein